MKAARYALLILVLILVIGSILACIGGGGGDSWQNASSGSSSGYFATATYGAEIFHVQLTAISAETTPESYQSAP
jgi:hypothetical protein